MRMLKAGTSVYWFDRIKKIRNNGSWQGIVKIGRKRTRQNRSASLLILSLLLQSIGGFFLFSCRVTQAAADIQGPLSHAEQTVKSWPAPPITVSTSNTQGNLIAVFLASWDSSGSQALGVTDSQGNSYTGAGASDVLVSGGSGSVTGEWFYAFAKSTGANTVSGSFSGGYVTMRVLEYSGVSATNPLDKVVSGTGSTSPTFSTSQDSELVLSAWHVEGSGAANCTAGSGYSFADGSGTVGEANVVRPVEQRVTTSVLTDSTTSLVAGVSSTISGSWVVSFRAASAAVAPTFSVPAGTYPVAQNVTLTSATSGAAIHYTTDGSTPTASSTLYTGAINVSSSETIEAIAVKPGVVDSEVSSASYVIDPSAAISFTTAGSSFAPIIKVTGTPTVHWYFADGSTSDSLTPTANFGSAATRVNYLVVSPWSALTQINIGYNGDDGGVAPGAAIAAQGQQNVTAVGNLFLAASSLQTFAASRNPISALDFSNFTALTTIECYACTSLTTITLANVPLLYRLCLEDANLTDLDLSQAPQLADLRGALQGPGNSNVFTIHWGSIGSQVWHICIRDNPSITSQTLPFSQFPLLQELFNWDDNQTGTLAPVSTHLTSVQSFGNHYTAAHLAGLFAAGRNGYVNISYNDLTSLDISSDPGIIYLDVQYNDLDQAAVDGILGTMDGYGTSGGTLNLTHNAAPSVTGEAHLASLLSRGWTVLTDSTTVSVPVFSVAGGTYASAQSVALSSATAGATIYYTTDGSDPTASSTVYASPIIVSSSSTVKAIALKDGLSASAVVSASYAIVPSAISLVSQAEALPQADGAASVAATANHTQGDLIAVFLASYGGGGQIFSITDSQGNTYIPAGTASDVLIRAGGYVTGEWFYTFARATGANTVTGYFTGSYYSMRVLEYAGIDAIHPADVTGLSGAGSTSPSFSTSSAAELVLAAWHTESLTSAVAGSGYTFVPDGTLGASGAGEVRRPVEQRLVSVALSNETATLANTGGTVYGSWLVSFRAASASLPTFSIPAGTYTSAQSVALASATPGVTIYYTTDGSDPTTASSVYTSPLTLSSSQILKAIAVQTGLNPSGVTSASYVINIPSSGGAVVIFSASNNRASSSASGAASDSFPYPSGTLLQLPGSPKVYVMKDGKKEWVSTPEVFEQLGYQWTNIQQVTGSQLASLPDYEDNLIRAAGDYCVYLVVDGVKRHLMNPAIFLGYGFSWDDIKQVDASVLDQYAPAHLIKQSGDSSIYYLSGGIRRLIPTDAVFQSYGDKYEDVQVVSQQEMEGYPLSNLIRLSGANDVYLAAGETKHRIASPAAFASHHFDWSQVMTVNATELGFYKGGEEIG